MKKAWIYLLLAALLVIALTIPAAAADASTPHCYCGGTSATGHKVDGCTGNLNQPWTAYTGSTLPTTGGYYYLSADIKNCSQAGGTSGVTGEIYLDLNGHTVQMNGSSYAYLLNSSAKVTITDFVGNGTIKAAGTGTWNGGLISMNSSRTTLQIYGGTLDANGHNNSAGTRDYGGTISNVSGGTINIYGGNIIGGTADHGGAIYTQGKINLYGGTITGGTATGTGGGALCVERGIFTMYGGTINGGTATATSSGGGTVALYTSAVFTMKGGTITGGTSLKSADLCGGGNILITNSTTFNMEGGTISNGTGVRGGNVCNLGKLNISGGVIENGKTTATDSRHGGGNVYQGYHSIAPTGTMTGGTLRNGTAAASGGNFCMRYGTFTMSGGTMVNDITQTPNAVNGGNAAVTYWTATFNMTGGTITGGHAMGGGAAIAIACDGGTINISNNAKIYGGKAKHGGALYIDAQTLSTVPAGTVPVKKLNISGGTITGGEITGSGGAIYLKAGSANISGGTINGGTVQVSDVPGVGGGTFALDTDVVMNISGGTINGGTDANAACGIVKKGTVNITGGTVAHIVKSGGTVNISGTPTATIALDEGQYVYIPRAVTGGRVKLSSSKYDSKLAEAASESIAQSSVPYLFAGFEKNGEEILSKLYCFGREMYVLGALMYDTTAGKWDESVVYQLDQQTGGQGKSYRLLTPVTYTNLNLAAGTVLDLNGNDLTVTGEANLDGVLLVDSATSGYDSSGGYGKLHVGTMIGVPARSGVDTTTYYRYVTILDDDGKYSAHRIYVGVQSAVLNPYGPSINFRTIMKCDQTVGEYIREYGALFIGDKTLKSKSTKPIETGNSNQNPWLTTLANASAVHFERAFTSCAYMLVDDNWPVEEEKTVKSSSMERSIQGMVEYADSKFTQLNLVQQNALVAMYRKYTDTMSNGWEIIDIPTYANTKVWTEGVLPTTSGHYKLGQSYTLTEVATPANDAVIWLDLNGCTVTGVAAGIYNFTGVTGATLWIYDSSNAQTGKLVAANGCTAVGGIINLAAGNTLTLKNGTLDGSGVTVAGSGAAIYAEGTVDIQGGTVIGGTVTGENTYTGGGAIAMFGKNAKLCLTGGTIRGGSAAYGGAVLVQGGALFEMTGGEITGASAKYDGGNVFVYDSQLYMSDGKITGGTLGSNARYGTNVCLWGSSTMNMSGGTITGGAATGTTAYGGVYVNGDSTVTVSGNVNITGNTYNGAASNLFVSGSVLNIGAAGLTDVRSIGISVEGGNGKITSGENITADTAKYLVADDGTDIIFTGEGMPLYIGGYSYQVGYAEMDYGNLCIGRGLSGYGNDAERICSSVDSYGLDIEVLVVTDNEGDTAVICSVEAITITTAYHNTLRGLVSTTYDIPVENVMIGVNHQHSTPLPGTTITFSQNTTFNEDFKKLFMETVEKAMQDRQPSDLYGKTVATSGFNFVRNGMAYSASNKYLGMVTDNHVDIGVSSYSYVLQETGAGDYDLQLVWFDRPGKDIVVANFPVHPHGLGSAGSTNRVASAGMPGMFRSIVSQAKDCHTMYISGAGGDMNMTPRSKLKDAVGGKTLTAKSSLSVYANDLAALVPALNTSNWNKLNTGQVRGISYTLSLNTNKEKDELYSVALTVKNAGNNSAKQTALNKAMSGVKDPSKYIYSIYHADAIVNRHSAGATRQMPVYAISIGDVSFGGVPYEMFSADGKTVKSGDTHAMTIISTLTNGNDGYVPSTAHMNNGGYSADITYVAKGSADSLNSKLIDLLNQLRTAQ